MNEPHASSPPPEESPIEARLAAPPSVPGDRDRQARMADQKGPARSKLIRSRAAVLATLFLGTGAFGIPLLWISGKFSRSERIVWSMLAVLYTLAMVAVLVIAVWWLIAAFMPAM